MADEWRIVMCLSVVVGDHCSVRWSGVLDGRPDARAVGLVPSLRSRRATMGTGSPATRCFHFYRATYASAVCAGVCLSGIVSQSSRKSYALYRMVASPMSLS